MLKLPFKLEKSDVQEHLEVMFAKFMEEKKKEKASKWNWMGQLQEKSLKKAKFLKNIFKMDRTQWRFKYIQLQKEI